MIMEKVTNMLFVDCIILSGAKLGSAILFGRCTMMYAFEGQ